MVRREVLAALQNGVCNTATATLDCVRSSDEVITSSSSKDLREDHVIIIR